MGDIIFVTFHTSLSIVTKYEYPC